MVFHATKKIPLALASGIFLCYIYLDKIQFRALLKKNVLTANHNKCHDLHHL